MRQTHIFTLFVLLFAIEPIVSFHNWRFHSKISLLKLKREDEYNNPVTATIGGTLGREGDEMNNIIWDAPKKPEMSTKQLASRLERLLVEREWFVTGNVDPTIFDPSFKFQDPDVKVNGIEAYARGVNRLFSQGNSRAEIVAVRVSPTLPDTITVTWRLSGSVNIAFGLKLKPFVVYTNLRVGKNGLIVFQEDKFSIPGYDIVLSSLFPFLVPTLFSPPAPSLEELQSQFLENENENQ